MVASKQVIYRIHVDILGFVWMLLCFSFALRVLGTWFRLEQYRVLNWCIAVSFAAFSVQVSKFSIKMTEDVLCLHLHRDCAGKMCKNASIIHPFCVWPVSPYTELQNSTTAVTAECLREGRGGGHLA